MSPQEKGLVCFTESYIPATCQITSELCNILCIYCIITIHIGVCHVDGNIPATCQISSELCDILCVNITVFINITKYYRYFRLRYTPFSLGCSCVIARSGNFQNVIPCICSGKSFSYCIIRLCNKLCFSQFDA